MKKNSFSYYLEMVGQTKKELPQWESKEVQKFKSDIKTELESITNNTEIDSFISDFKNKWNLKLVGKVITDEPLEIFTDKNQWHIRMSLLSSPSEGKSHYHNVKGNADPAKYNILLTKKTKNNDEVTFITNFPEIQKEDYADAKRRHTLLMGLIEAVREIQKEKKSFWIQLKNYEKNSGEQATFQITNFRSKNDNL